MPPILLADSGSTKTEWRLVRPGHPIVSVRTDGLNPYFQEQSQLSQVIQQQLLPRLPPHLKSLTVHFYGAGCANAMMEAKMAAAIRAAVPGIATCTVASDMLGAARSVAGTEPGIVCILGTGSNACYFDGQTITSPSRSLGFWLGDEGSGGYLGKRLVTSFLHGQLPPDVGTLFGEAYPIDRPTVLDNAYNKPYPNRYFARFTPFLSAHRDLPFSKQLVSSAFGDFIKLYVLPLPQHATVPIHFVGSVAYHFADWLADSLAAHGLRAGQLSQAPMDGLLTYHARL